jgi:hypothetical protein
MFQWRGRRFMRLFHFSDDPDIEVFTPRPVRVPAVRPPGREWLNGPLVWAIDEAHQPMYLFPRECPRILVWPLAHTTDEDRATWWQGSAARMIAFVEDSWRERLGAAHLYRYELPDAPFADLKDAGMWVARTAVQPLAVTRIDALPERLRDEGVDLRIVDSLVPLRDVWNTSLHASGLRLRNAAGWR